MVAGGGDTNDTATLVHHPLPPNDHGWAGMPPPTPRPPPDAPALDGNLKPWLGLRARLALSPISAVLVSLIFVVARMLMSAGDVDDKLNNLKAAILSTCSNAEDAATTLASLPIFMAQGANKATVKAIEGSVQSTGRVLMLAITAIEEVLKWIVDSYRSLFVCFIELLVQGSLAVLISAVQLISDAVHEAAQGIRAAIQASIEGANSLLSSTVSGINAIVSVFGQHVTAPTIEVPSLDALNNITLPHAIEDSLLQINSSLPTLDDLRQKMDALISGPFETMKAEINDTINGFRFNHSVLPTPSPLKVAFCHDVDASPLDDFAHDLKRMARIGAALIVLLMLGIALLCAGQEWWSWRSARRHVEYTREAWLIADRSGDATNFGDGTRASREKVPPSSAEAALSTKRIFDLLELSRHPLLAMVAFKVARFFGVKDPAARSRLRWWLAWIGHPAAVAALAAGLVGLVSVELQIVAVRSLQGVYEGKLGNVFDSVSGGIAGGINAKLLAASTEYANKSNAIIIETEEALNQHLFSWVDTTTTTMNDTLNAFMDDITGALNDVFGSTPLNAPLQTFIQCFLGRKVAGIQTALTWMHDNAHVNFTLVNDDVLMISNDTLAQLSDPIKASMMGQSGGNDDDGVVGTLVSSYVDHLKKERIMFYVFLAIYALVLLVGTAIVLWDHVRERFTAWRERRSPWHRTPITPFRMPLPRKAGRRSEEASIPLNAAPRCGPRGPRLDFSTISYPIARQSREVDDEKPTLHANISGSRRLELDREGAAGRLRASSLPSQRAWSWLSYLQRAADASSADKAECDPRQPSSAEPGSPASARSAYSQVTSVTAHGKRASLSTAHRRRTSRLVDEDGDPSIASCASAIASSPSPLRQRFSPSPSQHTFGCRYSAVPTDRGSDRGSDSTLEDPTDGATEPSSARATDALGGSKDVLATAASWWCSLVAQKGNAGSGGAGRSSPAADPDPLPPSASGQQRRQLRLTATPTDQVEARKRAQATHVPPPLLTSALKRVLLPTDAAAQTGSHVDAAASGQPLTDTLRAVKAPSPSPSPSPSPKLNAVRNAAQLSTSTPATTAATTTATVAVRSLATTGAPLRRSMTAPSPPRITTTSTNTRQPSLLRRVLANASPPQRATRHVGRTVISRPLPHPLGNPLHPCPAPTNASVSVSGSAALTPPRPSVTLPTLPAILDGEQDGWTKHAGVVVGPPSNSRVLLDPGAPGVAL
ncbi:plasma membrane fusion protein prm1 [Thecaphora frezii]